MIPGLVELGKEAMETIKTLAESDETKISPTEIITGDILKTEWWNDADILFACNVCFPDELNDKIGELCANLKPGSRVLALKAFEQPTPHLDVLYCVKLKMTWGQQPSIVYVRNSY